jgi:hypothetical protein
MSFNARPKAQAVQPETANPARPCAKRQMAAPRFGHAPSFSQARKAFSALFQPSRRKKGEDCVNLERTIAVLLAATIGGLRICQKTK